MPKFTCVRPVLKYKMGQVVEWDKLPLAMQAHFTEGDTGAEKKEFTVNPEELKAKAVAEYKASDEFKELIANADDEAMDQLKRIHKDVVGEMPHGRSGAEKIADDILKELEPVDDK